MSEGSVDVLVIGGGMVGLAIANQLLERSPGRSIVIVDKEPSLGRHSSGRNSGVLHAGLYYKPGTLKAQVCISGGRRLRAWCEQRGLPVNACGKVIVPQSRALDHQLDVLAERGRVNGATVEFWDANQLKRKVPEARTSSGRAP
jgi:(S)-2-hydroxyglutarate dehydrogenase